MNWNDLDRDDHMCDSGDAFISITGRTLRFNVAFVRQAGLRPGMYVKVYEDSDNFRLGFEFLPERRKGAWKVTARSKDPRVAVGAGMACAAGRMVDRLPWLRAIGQLRDRQARRFVPSREGALWVIQLRPAFEQSAPRDPEAIPVDARGIYRYVRTAGGGDEVVYIGRGGIRSRLADPLRRDWRFDRVDYSVIADPDAHGRWERYWIDRHIETHGALPEYNQNRGG